MKLLRIRASHFKNCEDNFTIDFVAKSKKTAEDKEYELQEIAEDLFVFNTAAFVGKNASGFNSLDMGLPFSSLPTVTITRKGFFRLRFFILLICPNPFGSRFLLLFLLLGFRAGAPSCNGYPQCGHDKALSLTCYSHSGIL